MPLPFKQATLVKLGGLCKTTPYVVRAQSGVVLFSQAGPSGKAEEFWGWVLANLPEGLPDFYAFIGDLFAKGCFSIRDEMSWMKSNCSGPSRESIWGMIFLAAVPMLIMSFVVLIMKKMPFVRQWCCRETWVDPILQNTSCELLDKSR